MQNCSREPFQLKSWKAALIIESGCPQDEKIDMLGYQNGLAHLSRLVSRAVLNAESLSILDVPKLKIISPANV